MPESNPSEVERSLAIAAILSNAPTMGLEASVKKFGASLTSVDRELIGSLTPEELGALKEIEGKISPLRTGTMANNNNNNNKPVQE
jgi:hypothetical protein